MCVQACRALGNLAYGWGVDPIKAAVGTRGVRLLVTAIDLPVAAAPSLFRWQAHALRNLAVRSTTMQDAIGAAAGTRALLTGLRAHAASARAQEAGCKALAFALAQHGANTAAAIAQGALEAAAARLTAHAHDAGAVEAALTLLSHVLGRADVSWLRRRS